MLFARGDPILPYGVRNPFIAAVEIASRMPIFSAQIIGAYQQHVDSRNRGDLVVHWRC